MAVLSRRRRTPDFWPGFVDALAALLMVMIFVILIFTIGQFVLTDAVSGRDRALAQLNAELSVLAKQLSLETDVRRQAESQLSELSASLAATRDEKNALDLRLQSTEAAKKASEEEAARLITDITALQRLKAELEAVAARLSSALDTSDTELKLKNELSERAIAQVELLNRQLAAMRSQLDELNNALGAAQAAVRDKDLKLEELGKELNVALAARAQELARYRSEFFGRLRAVLGQREDIQIVGDRFVFSSEVLFPSGSEEISEGGREQLMRVADALKQLAHEMPPDLPWVLQVDGHTDRRPIRSASYPSNWELSTARALSVVKFLRDQGIDPRRLAATGYGEFHPLDPRDSDAAYAKNRRIELKLTNR